MYGWVMHLIRNEAIPHLFLSPTGEWTANRADGAVFESISAAVNFCLCNGRTNGVEVLLVADRCEEAISVFASH